MRIEMVKQTITYDWVAGRAMMELFQLFIISTLVE